MLNFRNFTPFSADFEKKYRENALYLRILIKNSMKNFNQLITVILAISFIAYLITVATDLDHINKRDQYETVENDPLNTFIYTLDNGLKIYMSINKDEPRIQTSTAINTGSKQDITTGRQHTKQRQSERHLHMHT